MVNFLKKLTVIILSLLITLAVLEVAARVFHLGTGGFWEPYPLYGWRNIPNAAGWESCYGECAVRVRINSLGLRDEEIPYEKSPGQNRIFLLGDSITAGMQVPLDKTFGKRLEAHLNNLNSDAKWEVINGAVNGFGTDNELLFYQLEARKYEPDIVLLGVYLANDIYNNSRVLELRFGGQGHKPYFELTDGQNLELQNFPVEETDSLSIRFGSFLKKHFQLPRFVAQTLSLRGGAPPLLAPLVSLVGGNRGVDVSKNNENNGQLQTGDDNKIIHNAQPTICDEKYTSEIEAAWDITKALVRKLRADVEADGAQFGVLVIPTAAQIVPPKGGASWYCERPNDELAEFLKEENIPYIDLLQPFREHALAGREPLYFKRDFHMNEQGHLLVADLLTTYIKDEFIIP